MYASFPGLMRSVREKLLDQKGFVFFEVEQGSTRLFVHTAFSSMVQVSGNEKSILILRQKKDRSRFLPKCLTVFDSDGWSD